MGHGSCSRGGRVQWRAASCDKTLRMGLDVASVIHAAALSLPLQAVVRCRLAVRHALPIVLHAPRRRMTRSRSFVPSWAMPSLHQTCRRLCLCGMRRGGTAVHLHEPSQPLSCARRGDTMCWAPCLSAAGLPPTLPSQRSMGRAPTFGRRTVSMHGCLLAGTPLLFCPGPSVSQSMPSKAAWVAAFSHGVSTLYNLWVLRPRLIRTLPLCQQSTDTGGNAGMVCRLCV